MSGSREFDERLKRYVLEAVKGAEGGKGREYVPSFAQRDKSGLSFGAFQNDVATNGDARETFQKILTASGLFLGEEVKDIVKLARKHGVKEEDFSKSQYAQIEQALASEAGKREIDKLDGRQEKAVLGRVEKFLKTVWDGDKNPRGPGVFDPNHEDFGKAIALVAAWFNRTGPEKKKKQDEKKQEENEERITKFTRGKTATFEWGKDGKNVTSERKMPHDGPVTLEDLRYYFSGTMQFSKAGNGEDFGRWFKRITENLPPLALSGTADGNGSDAPEAKTEALDEPSMIDIPDAPATPINSGTDDPLDDAHATEDRDADEDDFIAGGSGDDTLYGGSGEDRLKAEADRLIASDDYYRDQDKQARVAALFTELYPPDAEPDTAAATTVENPFEVAPSAPDTEAEEALQAEVNALIASADYWRDPHKQRRVAAIFKRLYPGQVRTAPLDFGEGI